MALRGLPIKRTLGTQPGAIPQEQEGLLLEGRIVRAFGSGGSQASGQSASPTLKTQQDEDKDEQNQQQNQQQSSSQDEEEQEECINFDPDKELLVFESPTQSLATRIMGFKTLADYREEEREEESTRRLLYGGDNNQARRGNCSWCQYYQGSICPRCCPVPGVRGTNRYVTGAEIVLGLIVASAGVAKRTPEPTTAYASSEQTDFSPDAATPASSDAYAPVVDNVKTTTEEHAASEPVLGRRFIEKLRKSLGSARPQPLRAYAVQAGDSLPHIASRILGDANLAWLIADINRLTIKETVIEGKRIVELKRNQVIQLPNAHQIIDFYSERKESETADNLVTIIGESKCATEKLAAEFGKIMPAPSNTPPITPASGSLAMRTADRTAAESIHPYHSAVSRAMNYNDRS
ncbi:MAG TPA: hypothetical protein V6D17_01105 [Candidatus Obscuribacterales bacterium]